MNRNTSPTPPASNTPLEAEKRLEEKGFSNVSNLSRTDVRAALHELQVREIELERQNEELRRAQAEAQAAQRLDQQELERRVEDRTADLLQSNIRLAHEIEERKRAERAVAKEWRFEALLADLSSRFVNLPGSEVEREILDAQHCICELHDLEISSLWQSSTETFRLTHLYRLLEGPPAPEGMTSDEYFPWIQRQLQVGRTIAVSSMDELPAEAVRDRETYCLFRIKSSLVIPLMVGGEPPIGAMGFSTTRVEREWPDALVKRLQLAAQIFANALARKRAVQALSGSEERLRQAAEAAGFGAYRYDLISGKAFYSPEFLALYGLPPDATIEQDPNLIPEAVHPDDKAGFLAAWIQSSDPHGSGVLDAEFRVLSKDGKLRWLRACGRTVFEGDGPARHPVSAIGIIQDSTERKKTYAALQESLERFRQVAEATGKFIWEVDASGLYTYASPSVERILGYTPEELVGEKHFYDLFDPLVRVELKAAAFQIFAAQQAVRNFPNPNVSKSGKIIHMETSGLPVLDLAGNLIGYRGAGTDVTERKRAKELLQESEARFRTVANTAPVLIWMASTDKLCNFFNKSWLDFTGRPLEQELGNGWTEGVHPEDLARCMKIYLECFDARRPFTMEYRLRRHDGEYRWISDHAVPRYDSERVFLGYIGSCVDLTERKRAEEALRQSEERLRLVLEANSEGVWDWNIPSGKAYFSPRYSRMLGYEPEEFPKDYEAWKALVHPDDFEGVHAEHVAHIHHGKEFCVEFRMLQKSGDWCWIRSRGTVVERDAAGGAIRMVGTHLDITERMRSEAALRASEEVTRATFEQAAVGIAHIDIEGRWIRVNDRLCAILGYQREELMKLNFQDITHPEDLEKNVGLFRQFLSGEIKTFSMEKRCIRNDRSVVWTILSTSLLRTASGTPKHFIIVIEDITERKNAEEAIRDLSGRLINAQEAERARVARELHDGLSQNLALQAVALELLGQQAPPDDVGICSRVRELSSQMKLLSTEVHRIAHALHPAKLTQLGLVATMAELCHEGLSVGRIPIAFAYRGIPRKLPQDVALCLYRVTQESIQNVDKHSGAKRASVELTMEANEIHLRISDDGVGFDIRSNRATHALGIVSMRERVRLVQGEITVESEPGKGTQIHVRVPLPKTQTA